MAATAAIAAVSLATTYYTTEQQKKAAAKLKTPPLPKADTPDAAGGDPLARRKRLAGIGPTPTTLTSPLGLSGAAPGTQKTLLGM